MSLKVALITGVNVQDGACLTEFLLKKNYIVLGLKRRTSLFNTDCIENSYQDLTKAKEELAWERRIQLNELVEDMMPYYLEVMNKDESLRDYNYSTYNYFE